MDEQHDPRAGGAALQDAAGELAAAGTADNVMEILAGVERQFERLRSVQEAHADQVDALARRSAELDALQQDLTGRAAELEERHRGLQSAGRALEGERERLEHHQAALADQARELEGMRSQLEATGAEQGAAAERLRQREEEVGDHEQRLAEAAERLAQVQVQLEAAGAELERVRAEHASMAARAEALAAERSALNEQLEAAAAERGELQQRLADLDGELTRQREHARATEHEAMELMQELEQQRDDLKTQVEALRDELEQATSRIAGGDERIEALERELGDARSKLQIAGDKLRKFSELLAGPLPLPLASPDAAQQHQAQQQQEIERLRGELEEAKQVARAALADGESVEWQQQRIEQLERELAAARAVAQEMARDRDERLQAAAAELEVARQAGDPQELHRRDERISELTEALKQARGQTASLEQSAELQRRNRKLQEELEALQQRLESVQANVGREPEDGADYEQRREQIRRQQLHLEEVRKLLAAGEKQMVRKWARNRSVITICCLFILFALNGVGSWFAAGVVFPPKIVATATLRPEGGGASPNVLAQWQRWHTGVLYEESFHTAVGERMSERLMRSWQTPEQVRGLMVKEISVDVAEPGNMTLTVQRQDANEARALLEVISSTLVNESRRRELDRGAQTPAIVQQAPVELMTTGNQRVHYALPIFGGACVITLALIGIAFSQWSRSRGVLDGYSELFEATRSMTAGGTMVEEDESLKPLA